MSNKNCNASAEIIQGEAVQNFDIRAKPTKYIYLFSVLLFLYNSAVFFWETHVTAEYNPIKEHK